MGTRAHVIVTDGDESLLDLAERRIAQLEARWSRFRESSEISALNRAAGRPTVVSHDTALLVDRCVRAWRRTQGAFDPTVHDSMVDLGYDRDFAEVVAEEIDRVGRPSPAPGLAGTVVDVERGLVWLRPGVHLDPGGIGKGLAADLVCCELRTAGAEGVCVNLGGDLRVEGRAPGGSRWTVSVEDPFDGSREIARMGVVAGAVATTSRLRRTWRRGGEAVHHVVDPRTGAAAETTSVSVTVLARSAWWAEVAAKKALLAHDPIHGNGGASVIAVDEDGGVRTTPDLEGVLTCSAH
jgi:thiamine biosynthesis lipoprotein